MHRHRTHRAMEFLSFEGEGEEVEPWEDRRRVDSHYWDQGRLEDPCREFGHTLAGHSMDSLGTEAAASEKMRSRWGERKRGNNTDLSRSQINLPGLSGHKIKWERPATCKRASRELFPFQAC